MIKINSLSKSFKEKKVLDKLSVEFTTGLNFIVGASGSGKTTLLKILSGVDKNYEGEVLFKGKAINSFNEEEVNSYYFNSVGFIWQNFNLIEYMTVEENIEVVLNLGKDSSDTIKVKTRNILKKLAIEKLAKTKVGSLSGGQKQRVAIARSLVNEPEVIIADEPTGALDKKSAKVTMDILKKLSKDKTVIVVTHDKTLIEEGSNVYELYKGTLVEKSKNSEVNKNVSKKRYIKPDLSIKNGIDFTLKSFKGRIFKNILVALVIAISSLFLVVNLSGEVVNEQQEALDNLVNQRGDKLRDIMVANSRLDTFGSEESTAFKQDIREYLTKYSNDPRIENFLLIQFINDIKINIPGIVDNFEVRCVSTSPNFDSLVEGRLPNIEGREVAISSELVKKLGLSPNDVIGKTINIDAWTYNDKQIPRDRVDLSLNEITIVGVVDSTIYITNREGKKEKTNREDSMFFSLDVINEIKDTIESMRDNVTFTMRIKEIKDILPIVEELNSDGIIAIGEFEDVKDILKISNISTGGTKAITSALAVIGIISLLIVSIINSYLRKYEFAVFKINGYSKGSLLKLNLIEGGVLTGASAIMLLLLFVPANSLVLSKLNISLSGISTIMLCLGILIAVNIASALLGYIISITTNISKSLMSGER